MGGVIGVPQNIRVYVRPNCSECEQVLRYLEDRGLRFQVCDVERDADALEDLNALGVEEDSLPVTFLDDVSVTGFDTNRLDATLAHITV